MFILITGNYEIVLNSIPIANGWDVIDDLDEYDATFLSNERLTSLHSIKLYSDGVLLKNVLIGGYSGATGIHPTSQVYDDYKLAVCCSDTVFCFSIPGLDLLWKTEVDEVTCFEIFKYEEDYIVHGELEISRLSSTGEIVWQKSGADIFTTLEGKEDFLITQNYIKATDFDGRKYYFDFNGNEIDIE